MPIRNGGNAITIAPTPAAHRLNSNAQPTGTASTKRSECLRPKLAASAVDRVVLGPGVKVAAVANSIKAVNSTLVMGYGADIHGPYFIVKTNAPPAHFEEHLMRLHCLGWQHRFEKRGVWMLVKIALQSL